MKQLYANNAKTTLNSSITASSTSLTVVDGSLFPSPAANEFFICTLDSGTAIEIFMITARSGNTFTIGGLLDVGQTVPGRGQEGTTAQAFSAGVKVECRVTKNSLNRYSTNMTNTTNVEALVAPKDAYSAGFVTGTLDAFNAPVIVLTKDANTWQFLTLTRQGSAFTSTAGTTTSISAAAISFLVTTNNYYIQFTSGPLTGYVRPITSISANTVNWTTVTPSALTSGVTFEIYKSNAAIVNELLSLADDAVIMPLLLGGE